MQVDLTVRKDGLTSGNSLIICSCFSGRAGRNRTGLFFVPASNQWK